MKHMLLFTAALLAMVPDIAAAQAGPGRPPQGGAPNRPGPGGPSVRPTPQPGRPRSAARPPRPDRPGGPAVRPPVPGRHGNPGIRPPQPGRPGGPGQARPPFHRPGAGRPPNFRPIQRPPFRYPSGYRYRRWSIGLLLPGLFLSSRYYFDDYLPLGVGAPPPGCRWVRYGPDLLLVETRSRRIVDVIYGAFL